MRRTRIVELLAHGQVGDEDPVKGWVRTARRSMTVAFQQVKDGS